MTHDEALVVVARKVAHNMLSDTDLWELYPEVGEYDWEQIEELIGQMVAEVDHQEFLEAYALLESAAEEQT